MLFEDLQTHKGFLPTSFLLPLKIKCVYHACRFMFVYLLKDALQVYYLKLQLLLSWRKDNFI